MIRQSNTSCDFYDGSDADEFHALSLLVQRNAESMPVASALEITEDDFETPEHKAIFQQIKKLYDARVDVDFDSIASPLLSSKSIEALDRLCHIAQCGTRSQNFEYYGRRVIAKNRTKKVAVEIQHHNAAMAESTDPEQIEQHRQKIIDLMSTAKIPSTASTTATLSDIYHLALSEIEEQIIQTDNGKPIGISTGFKRLDQMIYGFCRGNLYFLAGRPGMGKTTLGMQFARAAANAGHKPVVFSMEMTQTELGKKILSGESKIQLSKLIRGELTEDECGRLMYAAKQSGNMDLRVNEIMGSSITTLEAEVKKLIIAGQLDFVIADYVGLIRCHESKFVSKQAEITEITARLKAMAKNLRIPVLALAQLNRDVEKRASRKPILSDLRESGSIEQDGDAVMFIYQESEESESCILSVAKNRHGVVGDIVLNADKARNTFTESDDTATKATLPNPPAVRSKRKSDWSAYA